MTTRSRAWRSVWGGVMGAALALLFLAGMAPRGQSPAEVSLKVRGAGTFSNQAALLVDGVIPQDATSWDDAACVFWEGTGPSFLFDMGGERLVRDVLLCVDNNDTYRLDFSRDGREWTELLTVLGTFGKVDDGMETFTSKPGGRGYDRNLVFEPATARYLRLSAVEGDDQYAAAELKVLASPSGAGPSPIPPPPPPPPPPPKPAPLQAQSAQALPVAAVKGTGTFNNSPSLLVDGRVPADGTDWQDPACVWWQGPEAAFIFDLGRERILQDLMLQVDNNDDYQVDYSLDGKQWASLVTVKESYGDVGSGTQTFATAQGNPKYAAGIRFRPVKAKYVRLRASGGDGMYAASEVQFFGADAAGR